MKKMTDYQRELVAQNLDIVERTIKTRIKVNGQALQSYEDFYQIGCEALCRAAMDYNAEIGNFAPFGSRYVYNALIDHCRKQNNHSSHRHDHISDSDNDFYALDYFGQFVDFDDGLYLRDLNEAFSACKEQYSGIARRGIFRVLKRPLTLLVILIVIVLLVKTFIFHRILKQYLQTS